MLKTLWLAFNDPIQHQSANQTLFKTKMAQIDSLFLTKPAKKPHSLGLHIPI